MTGIVDIDNSNCGYQQLWQNCRYIQFELLISKIQIVDISNSNCRYQQLLISTIGIVDIDNSNYWYLHFELSISTILLNCWYPQFKLLISTIWITHIRNSNCGYQQLWINVNSACHIIVPNCAQAATVIYFYLFIHFQFNSLFFGAGEIKIKSAAHCG